MNTSAFMTYRFEVGHARVRNGTCKGFANCIGIVTSMRLPFADSDFDTVILDDVLREARDPSAALNEAARLLKPGGRLLLLSRCDAESVATFESDFATLSQSAGLRLAKPRQIPARNPVWLLAVATTDIETAAA